MNAYRREKAKMVRFSAAELAASRPHPRHMANGDEQKFRKKICNQKVDKPSYLASFTKGMPHDSETGLVDNAEDFEQFVTGIDSGDPRDFRDTRLGPAREDLPPDPDCEYTVRKAWRSDKAKEACAKVRAWESQGAGNTFDLEGPDAQAVTMPPAPAVGSDELIAEMGEVYAQALLRDVPFTELTLGHTEKTEPAKYDEVDKLITLLNCLDWFADNNCCGLTPAEAARKRGDFTRQTVFRGITPGDDIGPYISQFLLVGNAGINGKDAERSPADGMISYGAISIEQKVRFASEEDHMIVWDEWLDVQEGADLRDFEAYESDPKRRFITTPRDLATYVHYDALYEAYLNACLILLATKTPFDPGIPFQGDDDKDHQQGFAHFGGPHILSLVTEVATRALKAVRFQKFNVHRRLRPEVLAARLTKHEKLSVPEIDRMVCDKAFAKILKWVHNRNCAVLKAKKQASGLNRENYLLPMAFCEGSPMHPSYGAGHATVAGACVTILKAFFDHKHPLAVAIPEDGNDPDAQTAYVAKYDKQSKTSRLEPIEVIDKHCRPTTLTVEGELNKLASNISIGRDWAGVHYFSDYIESLRMGEQIAIGILEEHKLTYGENFSMTVPLFDGGSVRI